MKMITHHRALTYLLQNRTIASYGKMEKKVYRNADAITGTTAWCDFFNKDEWGEIVLVHQEKMPMEWIRNRIFSIRVKEFEEKYQVRIDPATIPSQLSSFSESPTILVDTQSAIQLGLEKKLNKQYPYESKGYSTRGILILSIFDPLFGGFDKDLEIQCDALDLKTLEKMAETLAPASSFRKILLVDGLTPFEKNPSNCVYELLGF